MLLFFAFVSAAVGMMAFGTSQREKLTATKLTSVEQARIDKAAKDAKLASYKASKTSMIGGQSRGWRQNMLLYNNLMTRAGSKSVPTNTTASLSSENAPKTISSTTCQGQFSASAKASIAAVRKRKSQSGEEGAANTEGKIGRNVTPKVTEAPVEAPPYMRGRLKAKLAFWKLFCQSTLVLSWIEFGFPLHWKACKGIPPSSFHSNHPSSFENNQFVTDTINELVMAGSLERVQHQPYIVSPLGVVFKASNMKPRLVFDARFINDYLVIPEFKYEDLGTIHQFLRPNDFLVTTDYSKGYHHIDIHPDSWKYLGIQWNGQYYVFTSLPFGLANACWAFTKLTRELRNKWRKMGRRCGTYLDDGIHADQCPKSLTEFIKNYLLPDTEACGFVLNLIKSKLEPSQVQEYLGMLIDTFRKCFKASDSRKMRVVGLIQQLLDNKRKCSVHDIEVVAGNLISMHWAFGKLARLMTMSLYADIKSAMSNGTHVSLSDSSIHDLNFWLSSFDSYNGFRPIWQPVGFHMTFYTDAAGVNLTNFGGWAGWTKEQRSNRILIARGGWSSNLAVEHSTLQELLAIFNVIQSFNRHNELHGKRLLIKTDNEAVTYIINRAGSRDEPTQEICKNLLWYCVHFCIDIHATWIPREKNELADFYSKNVDSGDYQLDPTVFQSLNSIWGPFSIDLFSSYRNNQVPNFYSLYFCPEALGINAFNFDWSLHNKCWCNPPFALISKVWEHAISTRANMCVLIPFTPTAPWWHLISPNGTHFSSFVRAFEILEPRVDLFRSGSSGYECKGRTPRWRTLALRVNFSSKARSKICIP